VIVAALDRLERLLDTERIKTETIDAGRVDVAARRVDGYLDVLAAAPPARTGASLLMRTWFYPLIYEEIRPIALRFATGLTGLGRDDDRDRTRDLLGLAPGHVVLDVACGPGNFTGYFGSVVGPDGLAIGLDASEPMLRQAVKTNAGDAVAYLRADAGRIPLPDGCVDAATCYAALYLVNDAHSVVGEIARVVRPGGRIALLTSFSGRLPGTKIGTAVTGLATGVRFFGRDEIASWLREAGMTDVHTEISGLAQTITATVPTR
jgi:SAM-dependent methyltransferase